ncbi:hypothetical protein ALP44_200037 [Pseudomonas syringae pv. theae]|uniref:Uncharacterized protein n=1 Tax=Pseudomonas syringae pv. theae TaxID=103985 RepID=A0A3M5N2Z4_PSESX|nr:hypothetical protein ALP44_200037 [Pseudomonas syringae pv. theae]
MPESPKIPAVNITRCGSRLLLLSDTVFRTYLADQSSLFCLAASLPENNCLASIRTSTCNDLHSKRPRPAINPGRKTQ